MRGAAVTFLMSALISASPCAAMEVMQHREELGTLKEQGADEAAKEQALLAQEKSFLSVAEALRKGKIVAGTRARAVEQEHGKPTARWPEGGGERWMYRSKSGKRLQTPWIFLDMAPDKTVKGWECSRVDCGDGAGA